MLVRCRTTYPAVQFTLENPHPEVEIQVAGPDHPTHKPGEFVSARVRSGELDHKDWDRVRPGDWLLTGEDNRVFAVSAKEFADHWEIVVEKQVNS